MKATCCQEEKSIKEEVGEFKAWKVQKKFVFYIPSQIHIFTCIWIYPFGVYLF